MSAVASSSDLSQTADLLPSIADCVKGKNNLAFRFVRINDNGGYGTGFEAVNAESKRFVAA